MWFWSSAYDITNFEARAVLVRRLNTRTSSSPEHFLALPNADNRPVDRTRGFIYGSPETNLMALTLVFLLPHVLPIPVLSKVKVQGTIHGFALKGVELHV